ncbi:MAG: ATP-binding protein [Candidatus Cloacimonetes bacterium]|nr:ATP-binding protein [Candidatus Cloacimonadota bacterium]
MGKIDLNIQPKASIYSIFTRLNYSEWYALAEFVDNSTASFYQYEKELLKKAHSDKLTIEINYDSNADIITIEDNAYGMELKDFKRAILLDAKPSYQGGRNEFGYGLKTAATWFGRRWSVESTEYGSEKLYNAYIDIDEIIENQLNHISIEVKSIGYEEHYTKITISKLNRKISTKKIKNKICDILKGMYRRDLMSGKIEILFNGITLSFEEYTPLFFRDQIWKKEISFSFSYLEKVYTVKGFVGIMEPGSFEKAGFALFRRNRVVIGGLGSNYKPVEIFVQNQSPISLKLYGELDMDDFDINQAKDGFSWDSELEEAFITNLKLAIKDYISIAKMSKKEREEEETRLKPPVIQPGLSKKLPTEPPIKIENLPTEPPLKIEDLPATSDQGDESEEVYKDCFCLEYDNIKYNVFWQMIEEKYFLYEYYQNENKIIMNLNHDYNKFVKRNERVSISKIITAYLIGVNKAKLNSTTEGYVPTTIIRNQMSKVLQKIKTID